jgi:hypothetical protein
MIPKAMTRPARDALLNLLCPLTLTIFWSAKIEDNKIDLYINSKIGAHFWE